MNRYCKTAFRPFLIGLISALCVFPAAAYHHSNFDNRENIKILDSSNFPQNSFQSNQRVLDDLDTMFLEEILPSVSVFTNQGNVLQASSLTCNICSSVAGRIKEFMMLNITQKFTVKQGILICTLLKMQTRRVCSKIIPKFGPWVMTVLAHSVFSAENLCSKAHLCPKPDTRNPEKIDLPRSPTKILTPTSGEGDGERLWVIHLSDWHYDLEYKEGYEANCGEPVCCRPPNSFGDKARNPAGKWGDYNCDIPKLLIENMLEFIPTVVPRLDYILSTGDLPPHGNSKIYFCSMNIPTSNSLIFEIDVWSETQSSIREITNQTASIWRKFFKSTPFFPIIGNHESAPVNSFPTSSIGISSASWLYDILAKQWNGWLSPNTQRSVEQKGFYSARLPKDNLRIIGLNTNFWYKFNWWMLMRPKEEWDPEWMLKWMVEQLHEAETLGEKVWILGHMSAVDLDAFPSFGVYFSQIVARFKDTIVGQFYGHSHWDEFNVIYDSSEGRNKIEPVGVAYLAPSVTSFKNVNPAFRVYEVDKNSKQIVNHYTYSMDLKEANRNDKPEWKLLYDAKSLYRLEDLQPKSWHGSNIDSDYVKNLKPEVNFLNFNAALTERFIHDESVYKTFQRMASRDQHLNKYGTCRQFENQQQCRNRIVCKLRGTFHRHGPFRDDEFCKKQVWFPYLPEDWSLPPAMGKHVNVLVDLDKVDADELGKKDMRIKVNVEGKISGYVEKRDKGEDEETSGVTFEGLAKTVVRLVTGLVMGGDDVMCR
ncbi:7134_t:CDS:2 [Acaulospora morrowiae]|uniref:7134_t:CDS:1 n=1 Tax=Acaulospora morrowiae TaxID=94023 RepID=A0A9N9B9T1_9GLOM|nr:7134_t:CDS:2 [Acaulospora morrowiae]